ncbi:MAG: GGDEF domain-containing protein [Alphaproteobacteria bacterium]|nr:GGDEF domain-containing protein [Alphaproteobacteria bacterium]
MRIRELLEQKNQTGLTSIRCNLSLLDAARILADNNIGALPVIGDAAEIVGIISERDLVRSFASNPHHCFSKAVSDVMITSVITCRTDDLMDDVYETMSSKNIRHIPVVEDAKLHAMLSMRDFEFAHKRLKSQSLSDDLTGLHNLRHLLNILDGEFNRYRRFRSPLSVAAIKVDAFERITQTNGAAAGDDLIRKLTRILVDETRAYDSIGRTSDDRFAIVYPNTDPKTSMRACDRIMRAVRAQADVEGTEWSSISIGLAHANFEICDGMSILKWAGELVQLAAESGGDCIEVPDADDVTNAASGTGTALSKSGHAGQAVNLTSRSETH